MAEQKLTVGIADMKMLQGEGILITYALGSCIGLCFHDPKLRLGALLHIMLPLNMEAGRTRSRMTVKIAGGAKMFEIAGGSGLGNIGQRNIASVNAILKRENIRLLAENVGGKVARTLLFDVGSGQGCIRSYGQKDIIF